MDDSHHAQEFLERKARRRLRPRVLVDGRTGARVYRHPRTDDLELAIRISNVLTDADGHRLLPVGDILAEDE